MYVVLGVFIQRLKYENLEVPNCTEIEILALKNWAILQISSLLNHANSSFLWDISKGLKSLKI